MIRSALRYLGKVPRLVLALAADPVEVWTMQVLERGEHRRPACQYQVALNWERQLHEFLASPWPCEATSDFWTLWPEVMAPFEAKGVRIGRGAFGGWGDGEPGLVRAVWCLTRHLRPANVVETGVARGFTTRFILEALERNGAGHLWSIDFPPRGNPELRRQIGAAVVDRLRHRWTYVEGSSRQCLPELLSELGQIDLFVHDSRHTERNVRFELDRAWAALGPGGAVVADDIDLNWGFHSFMQTFPGHQFLVCYGEPLQPDPTRFDAKGLFGIARKEAAGSNTAA